MPARSPRAALLLAAIALLIRVAGAMPRRAVPTPSAGTRTRAQLAAAAASGRTAASSLTLLEQLAVRPSTETFYRLLLQAFVNYCSEHRRDWSSMAHLDLILADYFTYRYLAGAAANIGSQTAAALAFNKMFGLAAATLGISKLRPHLCGLRHGWMSDDLLSQRRTQEQVFRRGRWTVPSSMRLYAKETALLRELDRVHPDVYALGDLVAQNFCLLLVKGFVGANLQHLVPAQLAAALLAVSPTGRTAMRRPASRR